MSWKNENNDERLRVGKLRRVRKLCAERVRIVRQE